MKRQLSDRIETYESVTIGKCKCGQVVIRINGSDCTCNGDKTRYVSNTLLLPNCIFRCRVCGEPIADNFIVEEEGT